LACYNNLRWCFVETGKWEYWSLFNYEKLTEDNSQSRCGMLIVSSGFIPILSCFYFRSSSFSTFWDSLSGSLTCKLDILERFDEFHCRSLDISEKHNVEPYIPNRL
jgi:hypothetical protein